MKLMKTNRQLHLWIGLITSIMILMESITGLLMMEPWLIGVQGKGEGLRKPPAASAAFEQGTTADTAAPARTSAQPAQAAPSQTSEQAAPGKDTSAGNTSSDFKFNGEKAIAARGENNSLMGTIKGLHEGRIGGTDIRWLVEISAVGMILLTLTGIFMSVNILRAQSRSRKKQKPADLSELS